MGADALALGILSDFAVYFDRISLCDFFFYSDKRMGSLSKVIGLADSCVYKLGSFGRSFGSVLGKDSVQFVSRLDGGLAGNS